jgi:aminoglycoside phosphotransferase (APT) family kinase protein
MEAPRFAAAKVHQLAQRALGVPPTAMQHLPVGWGNDNWQVSVGSDRFILKLGPPGSAEKWAATHDVYRQARSARLPVPDLTYFDPAETVDGWTVRIFTWMTGTSAQVVLTDRRRVDRFFTDLGSITRSLHDLPTEAFTSRLDGSAPSFAVWSDYVRWRLPRVLDRVHRTEAFPRSMTERIVGVIEELAVEVDPYTRPSMCHRDLYLDNLLAAEDGGVAALLDFDGAEAWDSAIDVVKLRWLVFAEHPGSEAAFYGAYGAQPRWDERVRLAELLEFLNAVPNAVMVGDADFENAASTRLQSVLTS